MKNHKIITSFFLIFAFFLPAQSSQETILNQFFKKLSITDNYKDADLLEKKIWAVWNEHPKNKELTEKLEFGTELMYEGPAKNKLALGTMVVRSDMPVGVGGRYHALCHMPLPLVQHCE